MKHLFYIFLSFFVLLAVFSCREIQTEEVIQERVDSFAVRYFNWQYPQCVKFVTPESKKYLEMVATNVTENNIEMLRSVEEEASVEIDDITLLDDNNAKATVIIHNYLVADTIGTPAKFHGEGTTQLNLVRRNNVWYIDLSDGVIRTAYRQQSEEPSPDQGQD